MKTATLLTCAWALTTAAHGPESDPSLDPSAYVPGCGQQWEVEAPAELGMDSATNVIFGDREHDLVMVTRWADGGEHVNELIRLVLASVVQESGEGRDGS